MPIDVDVQIVCQSKNIPTDAQITLWVESVLSAYERPFELTVRLVDSAESQSLNRQYRGKDKPTNVLSFPFEVPEGVALDLLGDIVVCADVVEQEAAEQNKAIIDHWAHMIIHGCLHLLGFDHINAGEAEEMESIEVATLARLGINNPYEF